MRSDGRDEGRNTKRMGLIAARDERCPEQADGAGESDLVFDFTDMHRPGFADLSLILTARLQADPQDRVWVRALPFHTWRILRSLGLDHLFRHYPGPDAEPN